MITVAEAPVLERKKAADRADVIVAGDRDVHLASALDALAARGFAAVLAEGGPSLNGQLATAGLLDELCLTMSPRLVGGDAKRILAGPAVVTRREWQLRSLCEQDGFLCLPTARRSARPAGGELSQRHGQRGMITHTTTAARKSVGRSAAAARGGR